MSLAIEVGRVAFAGVAVVFALSFMGKRSREAHEIGPQRDSRGMRKKKPFFRRDVVEQKVSSLFPATASNQILALLDEALPTTFELQRLQLALLKLSDGNLDELQRLLELVASDAGLKKAVDIKLIGAAEWPEAQRLGYDYANLLPEEQEPIFDATCGNIFVG